MYNNRDRLIIFDADGTTIDAFDAINQTFSKHGMELGDLERFQKRHNLFKYLGGIKEFPFNLKKQLGKQSRKKFWQRSPRYTVMMRSSTQGSPN